MEFRAFKKYPGASGQDEPFTFGPKKNAAIHWAKNWQRA
jgi:hypothetical protein